VTVIVCVPVGVLVAVVGVSVLAVVAGSGKVAVVRRAFQAVVEPLKPPGRDGDRGGRLAADHLAGRGSLRRSRAVG
jgi:hypothetical protein